MIGAAPLVVGPLGKNWDVLTVSPGFMSAHWAANSIGGHLRARHELLVVKLKTSIFSVLSPSLKPY